MNRWTSSRSSTALALAAAAALVLTACGNADDETGANAPTSPAAVTTSAPVTTSATPTGSASATASDTGEATETAAPSNSSPAASTAKARPKKKSPAPTKAKTKKAQPKKKAPAKPSLRVRSISKPDAAGAVTIKVSGSNYDVSKGIYVALCGKSGGMPTNCGGGVDTTGQGGASAWISSNPPGYAVGLPQPYDSGGRFTATLKLKPELGDGTDCFKKTCYVASRADHTRSSDRSQDVYVPVKFTRG